MFYKPYGAVIDTLNELIGMKQQYEIYQRVKEVNPNNVQIVLAEDLLENPEREIRGVFKKLEIPFSDESLSWESLDDSFIGGSWLEQKRGDIFLKWHKPALQSTHIRTSPKKEIPPEGQMFLSIQTLEDREFLIRAYKYHLPYYNFFLREKAK